MVSQLHFNKKPESTYSSLFAHTPVTCPSEQRVNCSLFPGHLRCRQRPLPGPMRPSEQLLTSGSPAAPLPVVPTWSLALSGLGKGLLPSVVPACPPGPFLPKRVTSRVDLRRRLCWLLSSELPLLRLILRALGLPVGRGQRLIFPGVLPEGHEFQGHRCPPARGRSGVPPASVSEAEKDEGRGPQ